MPARHLSSVLLPEPLRPTIPKNSPCSTAKVTSRSASKRVDAVAAERMQRALLERVASLVGDVEALRHAVHHHHRGCARRGRHARERYLGPVLPQPVKTDLDETLRDYWLKRAAQHTGDSYAGVGMSKFPEDLRVYEHLLWESARDRRDRDRRLRGGASLWFRDRPRARSARYRTDLGEPAVVSIDLDIDRELIALHGDRRQRRGIARSGWRDGLPTRSLGAVRRDAQ